MRFSRRFSLRARNHDTSPKDQGTFVYFFFPPSYVFLFSKSLQYRSGSEIERDKRSRNESRRFVREKKKKKKIKGEAKKEKKEIKNK